MATSGDLTLEILQTLSNASAPILSQEAFPRASFNELKAALDRLASRSMVTYEPIEKDESILEAEAEQIVANGSHEARVFEALRKAVEGLTVQDLEKEIGDKNVTKVGQGKAFKEKWIAKTSDGKLKASVSDGYHRVAQMRLKVEGYVADITYRLTRSRTLPGNSYRRSRTPEHTRTQKPLPNSRSAS